MRSKIIFTPENSIKRKARFLCCKLEHQQITNIFTKSKKLIVWIAGGKSFSFRFINMLSSVQKSRENSLNKYF